MFLNIIAYSLCNSKVQQLQVPSGTPPHFFTYGFFRKENFEFDSQFTSGMVVLYRWYFYDFSNILKKRLPYSLF